MKLKKNMARLLSLVLVMGTLAGCSNTSSSDSDNKKKSAVEQRKENNELVVAVGAEPEAGFDAITGGHGSITKVFFSTLMKRDKELGWENDLATNYKVSDDKLTWTVTIRDDAKFTDGEKVTAEDVASDVKGLKFFGKEDKEFRITFDSQITARRDDLYLSSGFFCHDILGENKYLMEVKFLGAIPVWFTKILSDLEIYNTHYSKYGNEYMMYCLENKNNNIKRSSKVC